jgi:hypothetical protein
MVLLAFSNLVVQYQTQALVAGFVFSCDDKRHCKAAWPTQNRRCCDDRISEPYGVRAEGRLSLSGCHPNGVQAKTLG